MTTRPLALSVAVLGLWFVAPPQASGQCVSLTTLGSASTQNFDTLATAGTNIAWTDNGTIPAWYSTRTTYNAGTGSSTTGALYSFGVAATNPLTDRALGGVASGTTGTFYWAVCFTNNTGSALSSLDISYMGEQWRDALPVPAAAHTIAFEYQVAAAGVITDADTPATGWTAFTSLDFTGPRTGTAAAALDGNLAANRTAKSASLTVSVPVAQQIWMRWRDVNDASNDHGLAIDDLSVTPQAATTPTLNVNDVTMAEGDPPGTTTFTFAVTLTLPAGAGGVTFDIATADGTAQDDNPTSEDNDYVAQALTGQTIPTGSTGPYNFSVTVNRDTVVEPNETFFVNVTNIVGANAGDTQGLGTITNDDVAVVFIHDVQGPGAATPIPGATVTVEGVVIGDYQASGELSGFFLQEEDADVDADPATSEGIFVFCSGCPTAVAEGQRVRVTGNVSEFFNLTEITATTAGAVVVTDAGNNLAQVTPSAIDLPVVGVVDDFYEAREGMRVTFVDTLTVAEYFELFRFGHLELFEGGRPRQFTEAAAPNVAGYAAHLADLDRRRVIVDDLNNVPNAPLTLPNGSQFIFHPRANGGLSVGTQGTDYFRGGDLVTGLTGVLHWSFAGSGSADAWRIRPTAATPVGFTVANPRPATPPAVGGAIQAAGMNLLNYFTTIDTTASTSTGPCAPSMTLDCRGADSVAELDRQRERASIVICELGAEVLGLVELENTTASDTISDLLGAVNARCGGADPYAFANTGGTLGTDAIRVALIYRTATLAPVGAPLVDLDPVHNRPPMAQTFDVIAAANPAFGQRFTVIANHFKSKGCPGTGGDADAGDGQSCFNATRVAQASRLLAWTTGTVLPAAGDPDVLLVGDFNAYALEDPIATITGAGYTDLESALLGPAAYSYLFDGQLGHLDYALSSASLTPQVTGVGSWHINADEVPLFDYNDEIHDAPGEASFEEKPDGSALVPPRVLFQPASRYRASDHDPVLVGLFRVADLSITKTDSPDPVIAGTNLTYTITVTNAGPDAAATAAWSDALPAGTTFVSLSAVAGWSCTTPAVGSGGTVDCANPSLAVGSAVFTLTVAVDPAVAAGTILSNTATATSTTGDPDSGDRSATATTTVATSADLSVTKSDSPDPVTAGANLTYTINLTNGGPSTASTVALADTLPAGTTFVSLVAPGGWSCTTPPVGSAGTVSCSIATLPVGSASFTLDVQVAASVVDGTVLSNTATATAATTDPNPGDESATATTTVSGVADLSISKSDSPDPVTAGTNLSYAIVVTNAGASAASTVTVADTLPAGTTFVALAAPVGWACTTPPVGSAGTVSCSIATLPVGSASFTLDVQVAASVVGGTVLSNTATVSSTTGDPNPGDESATATTTVVGVADLSITKTDGPDPVAAGTNLTYSIAVTNAGASPASAVTVADTLPAGTTFVSLAAPGGWSCTTPAVGAGGTVSCSIATLAVGSASFTLVVDVAASVPAGTVVGNSATVTSATSDPSPGDESATATTTVTAPSLIAAVKSVGGSFGPGDAITYTIVLSNLGTADQPDLPGDELVDVLPPELGLTGAGATSGSAVATLGTNTVTWNGAIAAGASVTVTIDATIGVGTLPGSVIANQGTAFYDGDGDGTNEASTATDDPTSGGSADPTTFVVGAALLAIPTASALGLAALALLLAAGALRRMRRRSAGSVTD